MTSGGSGSDMEIIRRNYRLIALTGLSGDMAVLAVFWLFELATIEFRLLITAVLLASGLSMAYLFIKVFPERIAKARGLNAEKSVIGRSP